MNNKYINFYNNLVILTRNKLLYKDFNDQDTFSDRLIIFLFHFAFFLNVFKSISQKKILQEVFDQIFHQIEISIREIGYGDVSINKNMKKYVNFFYDILKNIDNWDTIDSNKKNIILNSFINKPKNLSFYTNYFDKLVTFYKNNSLIFFTKDIEEFKI